MRGGPGPVAVDHAPPRHAAGPVLRCWPVGRAVLLAPGDDVRPMARRLADGVADDPEHLVVVVDGAPDDLRDGGRTDGRVDELADVLTEAAPDALGYRLVLLEPGPPGAAVALAVALAEELDCPVWVHDGDLLAVGAGGLFVPPQGGALGWTACPPGGGAPRPVSHRFPRPVWDPLPLNGMSLAGEAVVEPLPGGIWLRAATEPPVPADQRRALVEAMTVPDGLLAVVLGRPGGAPVDLDDVADVWDALPPATRTMTRFVHFGPVDTGADHPVDNSAALPVGPALAVLVAEPVTFFTGLPVAPVGGGVALPRMIRPDGRPGFRPFAGQLGYDGHGAPQVLSHRRPVPAHVPEEAPGHYRMAPDAVLEVVPAGLWVRPDEVPPGTDTPRTATGAADRIEVVYEARTPEMARRLRRVAREAVSMLDDEDRAAAVLVPGRREAAESVEARDAAAVHPVAANAVSAAGRSGAVAPQVDGRHTVAPPAVAPPAAVRTETAGPDFGPAVRSVDRSVAPMITAPVVAEPDVPAAAVESSVAPGEIRGPAAAAADPAAGAPTGPDRPDVGVAPAVTPTAAPATAPPATAPPVPASVAAPRPGGSTTPRATGGFAPQPTPSAAASLVPPASGLTAEREWFRRSFRDEYDVESGAVAALLSQRPGLRAGADHEEVMLDLVAVRLFLGGDTRALTAATHAGQAGPHVPLGRCVAAGLRRVSSYRGAARLVVPGGAAAAAVYREHVTVTDWTLLDAWLDGPPAGPGDLDVRIWSSSGRRVDQLAEHAADRVVFGPGTVLRVLSVLDGPTPVVALRELIGPPPVERSPLDELAETGLARAAEQRSYADPQATAGSAPGLRWVEATP